MKRFPDDSARGEYAKEEIWPAGRIPDMQADQCVPYIEWHMPKVQKAKGIQIIFSGGGYKGSHPDGFEVAPARRYLNEKGVAVVTLKYRTPRPSGGLAKHTSAWQDLQRAIRKVRSEAPSKGLDPNRIGIMGSSAGGHLASTIATHTPYELRPDFQILIYPVITMGPGTHQGSLDGLLGDQQKDPDLVRLYSNQFQVKTHQTPPAIIILSDDDGLVPPVPNAIAYYSAMHNEGISCSLHVYPSGGHGYGYMPFFAYREQMLSDLSAWLDKLPAPAPDAIRVACIGDSITDGHGIDLRDVNGYPAQMQKLLGNGYNVRNFGISARTLMNSGDLPYMNEGLWHDALAFQPDVVVIMLGTNDSKEYNWVHKKEFEGDLQKMLSALKALPTQPKIYLCKPVPAIKDTWTISESIITGEIVPLLEKAVKKEKLEGIIDLHAALEGHPEMMQDDGIHPNAAGVRKMAETVAKVIDPEVKIPERGRWMMR
jgi:acetyl esterase/lipase